MRTLPAALVPVALGAALAVGRGPARWWTVPLAGLVSLALQVGVNYANDYSDGVRGTDDVRVGPVRLVASGLASPRAVRNAAFVAFGVAAVGGLVVAAATTWWLLVVGAASIVAGWFYTGGPRPYGYAGLGEVFVFVFFGLVATVGSTYVVVGSLPWEAWVLGSVAGALACALLVTNNLRDVPGDTKSGKRTLAVRLGDAATRRLFVTLVGGAFVGLVLVAPSEPGVLLGLVAGPAAVAPVRAVRNGATGVALVEVLGATGRLQLVVGVTTALGLTIW